MCLLYYVIASSNVNVSSFRLLLLKRNPYLVLIVKNAVTTSKMTALTTALTTAVVAASAALETAASITGIVVTLVLPIGVLEKEEVVVEGEEVVAVVVVVDQIN